MLGIFSKIKSHLRTITLFFVLFVVIFFAAFYLVNLDLNPEAKKVSVSSPIITPDLGTELNNRIGSTVVSMESYDDWAKRYVLYERNKGLDSDPDKDGLPNYLEYVYGTNPIKADTDDDGYSDKQEIINGYDPDAPGDTKPVVDVAISRINVDAPMIWSKSEKESDMLADLENGLSHFSKTASPGQAGNMIISGHSSNYVWAKGNYNHIFENLNDLQKGDTVTIRTAQQNGRVITYAYTVSDKFITTADDPKVFAAGDTPVLTLSTCWPIGTNLRRIIIKADLAK
jgi:LPXTG-site transpeptidase (sortase) family protein